MSILSRLMLALLKPIMLGVVVAAILLLFFPEFRKGQGLSVNWLSQEQKLPERLSYYDALANSAPAVANIYSIEIEENSRSLFRNRTTERTNLGSGVVMREDGYLLTCYHVIKNADSIYAALQDSRVVPAQLVGFDEITDLAVLKVEAEGLHVIPQFPEPDLRVGDVVMAIGNPLDLGQTITSGIVSRTGHTGLANYFDFVQTDAVLNQGNSGGALVDSNGYLVGITNANFKTLDSSRRVQNVDGVNFAVPYPLAKRVMDEIIENGTVRRGQLGFRGTGYRNTQGILVEEVATNGPAHKAGLRVNDVLLSINGVELDNGNTALDIIAETRPGSEIVLVISRDEQLISMTVVVAELKPQMLAG
ncbi:MAG: trypsin-like peptidase domain-containing protein [Glaciecola sp.]